MATIHGIKNRLAKLEINEQLAKEIIGNGDLVDTITRMEKLLDPEITYQILDSCACGTSKKEINGLEIINGEALEEKIKNIAILGDFHSDWSIKLNQDNTLTAGWIMKEKDKCVCVCKVNVNSGMKVSDLSHENRAMPLTYCFCCAGHCRKHLQKLLDLQLKTKKVVSSPINSGGEKPCEFIFEII